MTTPEPPFIACFDIATSVGVCDGVAGGSPRFWTWDLRDAGDERPARFAMFEALLHNYFSECRVDRAYHEAALNIATLVSIGATDDTIQMLRGLIALLELACHKHQIQLSSWPVQDARQMVIGRARFPKGTAKAEVLKFVRLIGFDVENDNEADAVVGWLHESALIRNPILNAGE